MKPPAILTAAPFRGLPQPEAHGQIKFNDYLQRDELRRALSSCVPVFSPHQARWYPLVPCKLEENICAA